MPGLLAFLNFGRREPGDETIREYSDRHGGVLFADPEKPCDGCAHSASGAPFPGHPSGERPCGFCVRNPGLDRDRGVDPGYLSIGPGDEATWYGGRLKARKVPEDNYIATDRLAEESRFIDRAEEAAGG